MSTFGAGTFGSGTFGDPLASVGLESVSDVLVVTTAPAGTSTATTSVATLSAPTPPTPPATYRPDVILEIAFPTRPTDAPVWVDVSDRVRSLRFSRGRNSEFDRVQAGTFSAVLDNRDRAIDPTYATSPYAGQVLPMRRLRIRARTADGTETDLYGGYVEGYQLDYGVGDGTATVTAVDGFKVLALKQIAGSYPEEASSARLGRVLDDVQWTTGQALRWDVDAWDVGKWAPVGDRAIDSGAATIQATDLSGSPTSALQHAQDVEATENGLLFVGRDGAITFHNRHRRFSESNTSRFTFGDGPGELPYLGLRMAAFDDKLIYSEVAIDRQGGSRQVVSDGEAQQRYFPRTFALRSLATTDGDALAVAQWWLAHLKTPKLRVERLTLELVSPELYAAALSLELSDWITVRRRPLGGVLIEQLSVVEGISHEVTPNGWRVSLNLSPADVGVYLVWDETNWDEAAWAY